MVQVCPWCRARKHVVLVIGFSISDACTVLAFDDYTSSAVNDWTCRRFLQCGYRQLCIAWEQRPLSKVYQRAA